MTKVSDWDTRVERVFFPMLGVRTRNELMPSHQVCVLQAPAMVLRRTKELKHQYALSIHGDYGLTASDYAETVAAFHKPFIAWLWKIGHDVPFVRRTCVFNFWRTTNMEQPIETILSFWKEADCVEDCQTPKLIHQFTFTERAPARWMDTWAANFCAENQEWTHRVWGCEELKKESGFFRSF